MKVCGRDGGRTPAVGKDFVARKVGPAIPGVRCHQGILENPLVLSSHIINRVSMDQPGEVT